MITGVQNVEPASPRLRNARPSRAIWLPVLRHMVLLKEHDVVMGSAVLMEPVRLPPSCTPGPPMPCVASLHH